MLKIDCGLKRNVIKLVIAALHSTLFSLFFYFLFGLSLNTYVMALIESAQSKTTKQKDIRGGKKSIFLFGDTNKTVGY